MKQINDDTKSGPGTPPTQPMQPMHPSSKGNQPKSKSKPLNLNDPTDLNYVELALKQTEYQQNNCIFKKQASDKGLSRPSSNNITEQIKNIIEKGTAKEDKKDTINKRLNDSNISKNRREYYK
ncbi:MAG: hypothetical protein V1897_14875 [Pseudomonadota bacterium]